MLLLLFRPSAAAPADLIPATINGVATVTATVVRTAVLAPSVSAAATVTASVVRTAVLAPSIAGSSLVSAVLSGGSQAASALVEVFNYIWHAHHARSGR